MRRLLTMLACTTILMVGPCVLDSWNMAVSPGVGGDKSFVGVELEFGDFDFVIPVVPMRN